MANTFREMSLQKFTNTDEKFSFLLNRKTLSNKMVESVLTKKEMTDFRLLIIEKLQKLKDRERDALEELTIHLFHDDFKNQLWERNHYVIVAEISNYINSNGVMPTNNNLVVSTGLSRQTIHKHLKEYLNHQTNIDRLQKFRIMSERVLAVVFQQAIKGDIKASRLFLESVSNTFEKPQNINTQNNYIQINGKVLSQEKLNLLSENQIKTIESVLSAAAVTN